MIRRNLAPRRPVTLFVTLGVLSPVALLAQDTGQASPAPASGAVAGIPTWEIDASHSQIGFSVRHFFTPVEGSFGDYEIELEFNPERPEEGSVSVVIDASSVDTGNRRRDDDLRGGQFFDTENHPTITFVSHRFERASEDSFVVSGDLTILGTTRPVELSVRLLGIRELDGDLSRYGRMVAGLEASATIDRRDYGVGSGRWAETVILGPDVEIDILLEARLH